MTIKHSLKTLRSEIKTKECRATSTKTSNWEMKSQGIRA